MIDVLIRRSCEGFPGGTVVKNLPAGVGNTGSSRGPGRSRMLRSNWASAPHLLSLYSGAREPQLLKPTSHNYWSLQAAATEARVPRAHAPQQEKPLQWEARAAQRRVAPARRN